MGTEQQAVKELEAFGKLSTGLETRRRELIGEVHRQVELELTEYRASIIETLNRLLEKYSVNEISRTSGVARSTIYRWLDNSRQEKGQPKKKKTPKPQEIENTEQQETQTNTEWSGAKLTISGEVGAIDHNGEAWLFGQDGEAWNRTQNTRIGSTQNWPQGAQQLANTLWGKNSNND